MSAQQSPTAPPPADHADGHPNNTDGSADSAVHPTEGAAADAHLALGTADLANLLANGQWGDGSHDLSVGLADGHAYDGHVALALDPGALPDIDSTLDMLTSSHHLFDVPALDVSPSADDTPST